MRLKVFASSTISDLPSERAAAFQGISDVPAFPLMSEKTFNAMDKSSFEACLLKVRQANIYILILGGRYGYEFDNKSITEWEYETAKKNKIPVLVFNLIYLEKEQKQKEFEERVGDFSKGRFWVETPNALELKIQITESIRGVIKEEEIKLNQREEFLYPNLIPISFPIKIFIAEKSIDREKIIEKSWGTDFKLKKKCTDRQLIVRAVLFNFKFCPDGWYSFETKIITFRDLRDRKEPLNSIVDEGTIDEIECSTFLNISKQYKNYFKALIKKTLIEFFRSRKIYKVKEKKKDIYRFGMLDINEPTVRVIKWQKKNYRSRKVINKRLSKEDGHVIFYRHLALKFTIEEINKLWFVCINPTWSFTSNGIKKSNFQKQYLSGIKERENSQAVFNHFKFFHYFFYNSDLFNPESNFIKFNKLQNMVFAPAVDDESFKGIK